MTDMAKVIDAAEAEAMRWDDRTLEAVTATKHPDHASATDWAWVVTCALVRQETETAIEAGWRLRRYVDLYVERYGVSPSMSGLRQSARERGPAAPQSPDQAGQVPAATPETPGAHAGPQATQTTRQEPRP